ncbi:23024_t:CDS:1, partial [Racocetra persica]
SKAVLNASRNKPNLNHWLESICPNFNALETMVKDIRKLENQTTLLAFGKI